MKGKKKENNEKNVFGMRWKKIMGSKIYVWSIYQTTLGVKS